MNSNKIKIIFIVITFLAGTFNKTDACQSGDKAFALFQYSKAIIEYEKCLHNSPDEVFFLERLGDSYSILDNNLKAEEIYLKIAIKSQKYTPVLLKYVNVLYLNNKLDKYQLILDSLVQKYPKQKEFQKLKNIKKLKETSKYNVRSVSFNASEADFAPVYHGNKIIFSSSRLLKKNSDLFTGQSFSQLYSVDTSTNFVGPFAPEISMKFNIGACAFFDDGKRMMFSANDKTNIVSSTHLLQLYTTEMINGIWLKPKVFEQSNRNCNNAHPAINSKSNCLIFSSDGFGNSGMDLYFCTKDASGNWKQPIKMRNNINTKGNEVFPVFINDSTVIFSSDGLQQIGRGLDLYKSRYIKGKWTDPQLLDAPFNSLADDFGLCSHDEMKSGYFTSNRYNTEGNEDIYFFSLKNADSLINENKVPINEVVIIPLKGKLYSDPDGSIISDASIIFYNQEGEIIAQSITNLSGNFEASLPSSQSIYYKVNKFGYFPEMGNFLPNDELLNTENGLNLKLRPLKKDAIFRLDNIYYNYDQWDLIPESESELNNLLDILKQHINLKIELSAHTDARGKDTYNMILSEKRAKSAVAYLLQNGVNKDRIIAKGYGETKPVNHCKNGIICSDDEHRKNRRTEVKIISEH